MSWALSKIFLKWKGFSFQNIEIFLAFSLILNLLSKSFNEFLLNRLLNNGVLWANDYYFYCDDFDALSMAILAGGNGIRKIYKTVKKEETQWNWPAFTGE